MSSVVAGFPPELIGTMCAAVHTAAIAPQAVSLDPLLLYTDAQTAPQALPSSYPSAHWPEPVARRTLASLCLVNRTWNTAARPYLWARVEIRMPRSWLAFVDQVVGLEMEDSDSDSEGYVQCAAVQMIDATIAGTLPAGGDVDAALKLRESVLAALQGPGSTIPPELLTPPPSRETSPYRLRAKSKSPVRWRLMRTISDAVERALAPGDELVHVPTPKDAHPGRHVIHLDFNHFRTIGMRRSVGEGFSKRFVTGERVELVLKELPNLSVFGATEYMDGALTLPVLEELLFRGRPNRGRGRSTRLRAQEIDLDETETWERRRESKPLEALDLTGCVSAVLFNALSELVTRYIRPQADAEQLSAATEAGLEPFRFNGEIRLPGLKRLSLRGLKSLAPHILTPFVSTFPSLTHLDLSGTRAAPELLQALGASSMLRLRSLALGRCIRLTSESIADFLVNGDVCSDLRELSLYGDVTYASPLTESDLIRIVSTAPCFVRSSLEYLDLSSAPATPAVLRVFLPQPGLRSLGFSYISGLPYEVLRDFVKEKVPTVEVLTLIDTLPFDGANPRQTVQAIHSELVRALATPPFTFSISLTPLPAPSSPPEPPTRLRVLELSTSTLSALGGGMGAWRVVRSKGGRGWYVDSAAGWVAGRLRRNLEEDHPLRREILRLAEANGNVSAAVGWHARKMEVLLGDGLLGRENGLYGAVSFAYQG